jgi:hypothetical protein
MAKPNIEALAREIAEQYVWDWVTGDNWYGYPANEEQEQEAIEEYMPNARGKALHIARVLGVLEDDPHE